MNNTLLLEKVDFILLKKKLTREYLAKKIGCTTQNLSTVLRTGDPKISFCMKICKALNISIYELFEFPHEPQINAVSEPETEYKITKPDNSIIVRLDKIIELLKVKH